MTARSGLVQDICISLSGTAPPAQKGTHLTNPWSGHGSKLQQSTEAGIF
ncbi:MAG: hypothetical protein KDK97_09760 [Verrucomicrobiales bacterium]|nr:hypothetical protein [Verrucomicrobiales bacterium]